MKNFDEIILELPEINLNEEKTRFGNCPYGTDAWGNCYDQPDIIIDGNGSGGNDTGGGIPIFPNYGGDNGFDDRPDSGPTVSQTTGQWVDKPCLGCAELNQPRPTFTPLGRALLPLHNEGCGGKLRPELRNKCWQELELSKP